MQLVNALVSTYSSFYSPRLSYNQSQGKDWKLKGGTERHWRHNKSLIHVSLTFWRMKNLCFQRQYKNPNSPEHVPREPPSGSDPEPTMKKTEENNTLCSFWMSSPTSTSSMGLWRYSVILLWLRSALWSDLTEKRFFHRLALDYDTLYLSNKIYTECSWLISNTTPL